MKKDTNSDNQPALWNDDTEQQQATEIPTSRASRLPNSARTPSATPSSHPARSEPLWDVEEVAAYLDVPKQTIYGWRGHGYGPRPIRVGRHLRWRPQTVLAWVEELERDS